MDYRSYRMRGTPDSPIAVYYDTKKFRPVAHWHPEVELILIRSGSLQCRLEDRDMTLHKGDILVFNPNQLHRIPSCSEDYQFINVIFSLESITMRDTHIFQRNFVAPLADGRLQLPNLLQPEHPAHDAVAAAIRRMPSGNLFIDDSKLMRYTQIVAICAALYPYCTLTQSEDQRQAPEDKTVRKAMIYIHNMYAKPLTLQQIAAHVHLHPNYLCNIFKNQTGHTVMEHLAMTRVDAAKFLLRRDALPMARVAELAGFPSERSFFRQFRLLTGMTPKAYQTEHRVNQTFCEESYI